VANPKIETLIDAFTAASINAALWNNITGGAATLDTVNDEVSLAVPTASGGINTFGTNNLYDATGSSVYARIGVAANGNGNTKTIMRVRFDTNNAVTMRVESGIFKLTLQIGGTLTSTTLPTYDPGAHRWWRLRESGGSFYADTSPDGLTWTQQASMAYSWDATNVTLRFESQASATEVAGNVSVISHVNTRLGGPANPNWPLLEEAWAPFWGANAGTVPLDRYVDVTNRSRGTTSVSRGRQYELDQVRAGEASLALANMDAALDPANSSGPWAGHVVPYQPYRKRAQWPATRNLLTQVQATGGDLGGYSAGTIPGGSSGIDVFSSTDSSGGTITASTSAWQGGSVFQFTVPSGTAAQSSICYTRQPAVEPSVTYTMQMQVRNVTASTSLQVDAFIAFANLAGTLTTPRSSVVTLTGSATAGWTLLTITGTAPADVARISVGVETGGTAAATCSVQVDGWQLERGSTATTWQAPGVWYPMYAGFTERWPSQWDMAGTYGKVQPTAVDTLALLSQQQLSDPLTEEISSNSPRFVYRLDDPAGSTSVADWTGNNRAAQLAISKYGAGSLTFGNAVTATDSTGTYTGSSGTVATINNPNPGTNLVSAATFISLGSAGITGPTVAAWTRMLAFRYIGPNPPASAAYMWSAMDSQRSSGTPSGSRIYLYIDGGGHLVFGLAGPTTGGSGAAFSSMPPNNNVNVCDGDWHLALFGFDATTGFAYVSLDGATPASYSLGSAYQPTGMIADNVGGFVDATVGNGTIENFKGDIAFVAEFSAHLSNSAMSNLYSAWKSACAGESTDARYARILKYAGYTGPTSLQAGQTTSMGPANIDGQDATSALQTVVDTENGEHYVDRAGTITFKARSARYNATAPVYTFGENVTSGEWPYEDVQLDFDSTHLSNQVTVTQEGTSQNFYATDATSVAAYFPRTMTRTINASNSSECQDAANYLLSRYKQPATRVSSIKLHPSANPALWPVCLSLELGMRARVMRRPPNVPATQVDCFVEQIQVDMDDSGEAWWTLQCSPADLTPYGIFASFHTTLASSIAAGVSTITINAGADNVNAAAAQIGQGQQLVLGQNTANQETVTVLSVAATSSGWSTVVVTLQAATINAHTAGDIVCEPLPSGVTDPTVYDASARFDAVNFAY
jgi:hypothetical protein